MADFKLLLICDTLESSKHKHLTGLYIVTFDFCSVFMLVFMFDTLYRPVWKQATAGLNINLRARGLNIRRNNQIVR